MRPDGAVQAQNLCSLHGDSVPAELVVHVTCVTDVTHVTLLFLIHRGSPNTSNKMASPLGVVTIRGGLSTPGKGYPIFVTPVD